MLSDGQVGDTSGGIKRLPLKRVVKRNFLSKTFTIKRCSVIKTAKQVFQSAAGRSVSKKASEMGESSLSIE